MVIKIVKINKHKKSDDKNLFHWDILSLGEIFDGGITGTSVLSEARTRENGEAGILKISAVSQGKFLPNEHKAITEEIRENLSAFPLKDTVLVSRANTQERVGESAYIENDYPDLFLPDKLWMFKVKDSSRDLTRFYSYVIQSDWFRQKVSDKATGTSGSMKNISRKNFLDNLVPRPPYFDQKNITEILVCVDNAIATTEKLITAKRRLKQGLRQKVFFSDKSKSWKMYKLGDLFERITRKNDIGCEIVLTSSGEQGLINQKDFFNRRVASADLSGYYLMRKGEFAYNRSSMKGYPYGAIKRLDRYETAALSTLYVCFRLIQTDFNSNFFLYLFEAGVLNGEIYKIVNEGARSHGLLNLSIPTFFDIKIRVPEINVQNKIAMIFETVDCEINVLAQYLEKLKTQKQGLMQQLLTGKIRIQTP